MKEKEREKEKEKRTGKGTHEQACPRRKRMGVSEVKRSQHSKSQRTWR
jgi:hypothetical protein